MAVYPLVLRQPKDQEAFEECKSDMPIDVTMLYSECFLGLLLGSIGTYACLPRSATYFERSHFLPSCDWTAYIP